MTSRLSRFTQILLSFSLIFFLTGCKENIIHGIEEFDANKIIALLNDSGITAEKRIEPAGTWSITVDKEYSVRAIKLINASRIIRESSLINGDSGSIVSSREEQRFKQERNLSREIERTLLNIPTVLEARVHLNQPVTDPVLGKPVGEGGGSGSVLLLVDAGRDVPEGKIAQLVAGASGIPAGAISVVVAEEPRDILPQSRKMFRDPSAAEPVTNLGIEIKTVAPEITPFSLLLKHLKGLSVISMVTGAVTFIALLWLVRGFWISRAIRKSITVAREKA